MKLPIDDTKEVDPVLALQRAEEMRQIMGRDLPEEDIALEVKLYSAWIDQEEFLAAWELMGAPERRFWKQYENYEEWLRLEKIRLWL